MSPAESGSTTWKHIGLHGHSVGTFACTEGGIQWKSALSGTVSTQNIPKSSIEKAAWTVFGKSGHLRIGVIAKEGKTGPSELRFDGFPDKSFDDLKDFFQENYDIEVSKHNISSAGTQYGQSKILGKKLLFQHCVLEDADEEGEVSTRQYIKFTRVSVTAILASIELRKLHCGYCYIIFS
ncbi:MAG: hypothetical protein ACI90V_004600 [Bacillariaceae sp.]|jgi:hypothetical protein